LFSWQDTIFIHLIKTNKSNIDFIPTEKKYSKLYYFRWILYIFNFNISIHFSFVYKFVLKV